MTSLVQLGLAAGCYWCIRMMYQDWKANREERY
jgi:peptide methionine sulfoxide reductase MsrA